MEIIDTLLKKINRISSKVDTHIDNPHAHPYVDPYGDFGFPGYINELGFASKRDMKMAVGIPIVLANGTDVSQLTKAGLYKCYNLAGLPEELPNPAYWYIKVYKPNSLEDGSSGLIELMASDRNRFFGVWDKSQSKYQFSKYREKKALPNVSENSYYSLYHLENKVVVELHLNCSIVLEAHKFTNLSVGFPLWLLPQNNGYPGEISWSIGAYATNFGWTHALLNLSKDGVLSLINTSDRQINGEIGEVTYFINK